MILGLMPSSRNRRQLQIDGKHWSLLRLKKEALSIAEGIVYSMNRREPRLTDPKHRILLDEEQCKTATQSLCTLSIKMNGVHCKSITSTFQTPLYKALKWSLHLQSMKCSFALSKKKKKKSIFEDIL